MKIRNRSASRVRISPYDFTGVTEEGLRLALDAPIFDSIELKGKLREKHLDPGGDMSGLLFFPTAFGGVRILVHHGKPPFEIVLY